jgi:hypothetical protein
MPSSHRTGSIQQFSGREESNNQNIIKLTEKDVCALRMLKILNWEFKDEM